MTLATVGLCLGCFILGMFVGAILLAWELNDDLYE